MKSLFKHKLATEYILCVILLLVYIAIGLFFSSSNLKGDEPRYLNYAQNLLQGFYSPPAPNIDLWSGPGYPLFLSILLWFNVPIYYLKVFNAIFWLLSVVFVYKSLVILEVSRKTRLLTCAWMAFGFPYYLYYITQLLTESFSIFLISLFVYTLIKVSQKNSNRIALLIPAFIFAFLALTKIIFAYVLVALLIILFVYYIFNNKIKNYFFIFLFALLFTIPYQLYTFNLTGKIFYWGNSGGLSMYWMTSPYVDELGDWYKSDAWNKRIINNSKDNSFKKKLILARNETMAKNHAKFFNSLKDLYPIETDIALKQKAIENTINHPKKFIKNLFANAGRLFFHYPYSYRDQTINTYLVLIPGVILYIMFSISLMASLKFIRDIPFELLVVLALSVVYIGGSLLLSAYARFFIPVLPIWLIYVAFNFDRFIEIKFYKKARFKR